MARLSVAILLTLIVWSAEARRAPRGVASGTTAGMGPAMRLHPVWGTAIYVNEAFAYHPRDFGQCRASGEGQGSIVVCGVKTGDVVALSAGNGQVLWSFRTKGAVRTRPWFQDGQVWVGSADGCLYRLGARTGRPLWSRPFCTDAAIDGDPVLVKGGLKGGGDLVLFSVTINKVYAVGAEDAAFRWEYHRDRPHLMSAEGVSSPTVAGERVYVGFSDGTLVALTLGDGQVVWAIKIGEANRLSTDVDATPVVDEDRLYSGSFSRGPIAIAATDGRVLWQGSWFGATRPAVKGSWLVFGTAGGEVVGVRKEDGVLVFRTRLEGPGAAYAPVVVRGWIVLGHDRGLVLLDGADGAPVERLAVPLGTFSAPASQGNRLFFVGSGGTINAVDVLPR